MIQPLFEHRLKLAGYETRVLELEGTGPPVVMFHGYADSADTWRHTLARLAREGRRAVAVDLPGFGTADPLLPDPILPQLDAFAAAVLRYVAGRPAAPVRGLRVKRCPALAVDSIQDVAAEPMSGWKPRVVEVVARIVGHAEALHHARRPDVGWNRERDDLRQAEPLEPVGQRGARGLGGEAPAPEPAGEPPADLGLSHERMDGEPGVTDQLGFVRDLERPQAEIPIAPVCLDAVDELIRLVAGHQAVEVLHDLGIRVQRGEGLSIRRPPLSEHQALGANHSLEP